MKTQTTPSINTEKSRIHAFPAVIFIGAILFSGFFYYEAWHLKPKKQTLSTSITKIEEQLAGKSTDVKTQSIIALVKKLKKRTEWSAVMSNILNLESSTIEFQSFSSSNDEPFQIDINGNATNIKSIQRLLDRLSKSANIEKPFIHSIQTAEDTGETTFTLTFTLK